MNIIENCSPYYIRFNHERLDDIVSYCLSKIPSEQYDTGFKHYKLSQDEAAELLPMIPFSKKIPLRMSRFSLFITEPGRYYGAHKDGFSRCMFSINYPILVQDDKCITSWYSDEDIAAYGYEVSRNTAYNLGLGGGTFMGDSREVQNFNKSNHVPLHTMTAKIGEGILFNTDIFHDWDNSTSTNRRIVLTLRHSHSDQMSFDEVKHILFDL